MVLVADTAAQIPAAEFAKWGVEVCSYPMYVDGEPVAVSANMSDEAKEEIRMILKDKNRNVSTSGLREDELLEIYNRHADEPILSLHMSATASSATAQVIAKIIQEHPELDITYYDSRHLVEGYSIIVQEAARRLNAGASRDEMDAFLKAAPLRTRHHGLVYDLFYLKRTGRIGTAKAVMGSAMKIIPMLSATDPPGNLKSAGKVKKPEQAVRKFIDFIERDRKIWPNAPLRALISVHGPHTEEAELLRSEIGKLDGDVEAVLNGPGHSNLPHAGPDYLGLGYMLMDD